MLSFYRDTLHSSGDGVNHEPIIMPWEATKDMWGNGFFSADIYWIPPNAETG